MQASDEFFIVRFILEPVFNIPNELLKIDRRAPSHTALPDHHGFPALALPLQSKLPVPQPITRNFFLAIVLGSVLVI